MVMSLWPCFLAHPVLSQIIILRTGPTGGFAVFILTAIFSVFWSGSREQFLHCGFRKFRDKSSVYRWYPQLDRRRFVYDTYKTMKVTRTRHGWVHMFITHPPTLTLQLHNFDLFRTCRTSSFFTVAWQLARFQMTRRIVRSLGDSWASCTFYRATLCCVCLCLCLPQVGVPATKTAKRKITERKPHRGFSFLTPKISAKFDRGRPLRGRQIQVGWVKIGDFRQIPRYISKSAQDTCRRIVSIKVE